MAYLRNLGLCAALDGGQDGLLGVLGGEDMPAYMSMPQQYAVSNHKAAYGVLTASSQGQADQTSTSTADSEETKVDTSKAFYKPEFEDIKKKKKKKIKKKFKVRKGEAGQ